MSGTLGMLLDQERAKRMGEARTCEACGREAAAAASDYRKAPAREPARKPMQRRLVLEEEFSEADRESSNWFAAALGCWCVAVLTAAWAVSTDLPAADVIAGGCLVAAIFFTIGGARCRAVVQAWRDQKREKEVTGG